MNYKEHKKLDRVGSDSHSVSHGGQGIGHAHNCRSEGLVEDISHQVMEYYRCLAQPLLFKACKAP